MPATVDIDAWLRPARWIRRLPERLLHPRRRSKAVARLRALQPTSLLVICRGNICRSPFGERYLRGVLEESGDAFEVTSAGFMSAGHSAPPDAATAAAEHDVDLSDHRSKLITAEAARAADMVLVMEPWHARTMRTSYGVSGGRIFLMGDFDPGAIERRVVQDPVCRGLGSFRACYRRMELCLRVLAHSLQGEAAGERGTEDRVAKHISAG